MELAAVLKRLDPAAIVYPKPRVVTEQMLINAANRMARRGYQHNEVSLAALEAYLQGYGVMLSGPVGTGKTMFFETLGIPVINLLKVTGWRIEDIKSMLDNFREREICLDDIGGEPTASDYGIKMEALAVVLEMRMDCPYRTHLTTNENFNTTNARYGARTVDRFFGLCKMFKFVGKSLRQAHPNARYIEQFVQ